MSGVEAVERALLVVEAFKTGARALSLKEIADETRLNKATILRLIVSLEKFQYVTRLGEGRYALGPKVASLGAIYRRSFRLGDHVIPALEALVAQTGETAAFFIRSGESRVCLFMVESTSTLRSHLREGDMRPLLPSGTGVILAAFGGKRGQKFDQARETYIALNIGERDPEIASVAAPVFSTSNDLAGSISISGPISHFGSDRIEELSMATLRAAANLTRDLGGEAEPLEELLRQRAETSMVQNYNIA